MVARLYFFYSHMKTLSLIAAFMAVGISSAYGQTSEVFETIKIVPSGSTSNGQPAIIGYTNNMKTAKILDGNLNVVKQINLKTDTYVNSSYYETTTVMPTGAEFDEYDRIDDVWEVQWETRMTATDLTTMKEKLSLKLDCSVDSLNGFIDQKGNISCFGYKQYCWNEEVLGKKYPEEYYTIIDGTVYKVGVWRYKYTFNQADIDNAEWKPESESESESCGVGYIEFGFHDYDINMLYGCTPYLTQTIFNDDDKWEYLLPKFGPVEKTVEEWSIEGTDSSLGVKLRRYVSERQECIGSIIYNEDGTEVGTLDGTGYEVYLYKVGGAYFISSRTRTDDGHYGEIFYKYDRTTTSVKKIAQSTGKSARIAVDGRTITVDADGGDVDEAILYNMTGSKVASARGGKSLTINADGMPGGVYNVATKNGGRITGAQKIVLK